MVGRVQGRRELESGPGLTRLPFQQDEMQARRVDREDATKAIYWKYSGFFRLRASEGVQPGCGSDAGQKEVSCGGGRT